MKRIIAVILTLCLLVGLFSACNKKTAEKQKFSETFIDYFDTVITIIGYEYTVAEFDAVSDKVKKLTREYHELYDIYNSYEGKNNIYTINKNAGVEPVKVDSRIIDLIEFSKDMYDYLEGKTDVTMGALLKLWHNAREKAALNPASAALPSKEDISAALSKRGFDKIKIDKAENTIFITENDFSLDVGAVAKGYAAEQIAATLEKEGITGYALSFGGNLRVIGNKPNGERWSAAIDDPLSDCTSGSTYLFRKALVTSGSYQRYFDLNGVRYHHIIDPDTGYPHIEFASISIMAEDSGLADCLSTALFSMSLSEGKTFAEKLPDVEVLWIMNDGSREYTKDFFKYALEQ